MLAAATPAKPEPKAVAHIAPGIAKLCLLISNSEPPCIKLVTPEFIETSAVVCFTTAQTTPPVVNAGNAFVPDMNAP